jgi:hypothetical protein
MKCGHCEDEITDSQYIYQWFPEEKVMKPVHNFHLRSKRKGDTNGKPKPTETA